jgi:hypothetical protein
MFPLNRPKRKIIEKNRGLMESLKSRKGAAIKAGLLIIFIVAAIVAVRFTTAKEYLTAEQLV